MKQKIDWIIHYVANGEMCDCCGKVEAGFPEYMTNAHTHGLEKYDHLDFQIVLAMDPQIVGTLLNDMGLRVQAGEKFKSGDILSDVLAGGYDVLLLEVEETGRKVLRIILPDKDNCFPGDKRCSYPYSKQASFETI